MIPIQHEDIILVWDYECSSDHSNVVVKVRKEQIEKNY